MYQSLTAARRQSKPSQTWDPIIGTFREQKVPLALSKSSISANSPDGRPNTPVSLRSSISSYASATSSLRSLSSSYTNPSLPRRSKSYTSQSSYHSHSTQRSATLPERFFQTLPSEIYDAILRQLRAVHESPSLQSCQTCYLRDLCALSLTSRTWDKAVVKRM